MRLTTLMLRDNPWAPAGRYVVLYEGQGDLVFGFSATEVSRGPGRIELDVVPENSGIKMELTNVDQNDPIRNVRVIMPGELLLYCCITLWDKLNRICWRQI